MPISLNEINRLLQSSSSSSSSNSRVKSLDSPLDDKKLWNHLTQPTISKTVLDNELDQIKSEIINSYQPNKSNNLIGKQIAAYLTIADKKIGKELREGLKNSREDGVDARGVEPKSESEKLFLEIASTPSISGQQSTTLNLDRLLGKTVYYNPSAKISDFVDLALSSGSIKNNQKQSTKSAKNENNSNQKLSPHMNDGFELIKDSHAQESSKLSTTTLLLPQSTAIATKEGLRLNPIELFESDQIRLYELSSQPRSSSSTQLLSFVKEQQTPTPLLRTARIQLIPITTEPSDRFVMHTATPFHKWPAIRELSLPILAASPSFVTTNLIIYLGFDNDNADINKRFYTENNHGSNNSNSNANDHNDADHNIYSKSFEIIELSSIGSFFIFIGLRNNISNEIFNNISIKLSTIIESSPKNQIVALESRDENHIGSIEFAR
ncbi:hypothetical protein QR98_0014430 [Sarcoptes scabiei]|uniref:Uncharacterized protein n=1 Tax=Sarcoptes scabiei TaxID=52283 RepID=A0A131ZWC9_SARSC|nr:hypothetical protein QR98_0014430 [Sarcoptes scabiei]